MRIILVGETNSGSRTPQRLAALRDLGHEVGMVSTTPPGWTYETRPSPTQRVLHRLRLPLDPAGANAAMVAAARGCDAVVVALRPVGHHQELQRPAGRGSGSWGAAGAGGGQFLLSPCPRPHRADRRRAPPVGGRR